MWEKENIDGLVVWTGESEKMKIQLIPDLGSKIISLYDKETGREWLFRRGGALGNQGYGSCFAHGDNSGWDEMFPTINSCTYPQYPWKNTAVPDHGEVWALPWKTRCHQHVLQCSVTGIRFPYTFEKTYRFVSKRKIKIEYKVTNQTPFSFSFLWAAHPLFDIINPMRIVMPEDVNQIAISFSHKERLGRFGNIHEWPNAQWNHECIRLDRIDPVKRDIAEKFYVNRKVSKGWASLVDEATGERVTLRFPEEKVPYLAVWINQAGINADRNVALEPSTGFMDDLSYAMGEGTAAQVHGFQTYEWFLEVEIT